MTSEPRIYPDLKHFLKSNISLRVKIIYKKTKNRYESPFHDRYAIVDDAEVWHFGPSLHGAGLREAGGYYHSVSKIVYSISDQI